MSIIDSIARKFGYVKPKGRQKRSSGSFDMAITNNLYADWNTPLMSRNDKVQRDIRKMRARARQLVEDDGYAKKYVTLQKANIVGENGFGLKLDIKDANGEIDSAACDQILSAWKLWCKRATCTVTGNMDWTAVLNTCVGELPQAGEFLVRKKIDYSNPFWFTLQLIEAECLDEQKNERLSNGNTIRMGVERDGERKVVAYWIRTENPFDLYRPAEALLDRVPASEIYHCFCPTGVNEVRGYPWFHAAGTTLHMLGAYDEANIVAARGAACKGGFWKRIKGEAGQDFGGDDVTEDGTIIQDISPGMLEKAPNGWEFQEYDPKFPHTEYTQFSQQVLRKTAAALNVAYHSLTGDLTGVNYSSARVGSLEDRDVYKMQQNWLIAAFAEPVFNDWLPQAINSGMINLPISKLAKYNKPVFIGRRWDWVDPLKDISATLMEIDGGMNTRSNAAAERGMNFEDIITELSHEQTIAAENDVKFVTPDSAKIIVAQISAEQAASTSQNAA